MVDLREELNDLFNDDEGGVARWVMIRHFTNERSEYWVEASQEAIGGPAYKYIDTLVQTYSAPALPATSLRSEGLNAQEPTMIEESIYNFYFENGVEISSNDEIFDLDYYKKAKPTVVVLDSEVDEASGKVKPTERYKVRKVEKFRCDEGRVEYKLAVVDRTYYR